MSDTPAPFGPSIPLSKPRPGQGWFGLHKLTVVLLAVLGLVLLLGLGLAVRATIERNEAAHLAAEATVGAALEALQRDVQELLTDYVGLVSDPDMADLLAGTARRAALIGRWVTRYSEVDVALVVDRSGRFLQMAEGGKSRPQEDIAAVRQDLAAFIEPWLQRQPQPTGILSGIVEVRGAPLVVAAAPLRLPAALAGDAGAAEQPAYLIVLRYLERDLAKMLEGEFGFTNVRFVRSAQDSGHRRLPVALWNGEAAWLATWDSDPQHPQTPPWVPLALVFPMGLAAAGLIWHLRKSARGESEVIETKSAEVLAGEKLIADIRTGIRQLSWNLSEGVVLMEGAAEIRYANAAAARLVGRGAENLLGTSFVEACKERFPAFARHLADYVAADPKQWSGDASWFSTVSADGRMIKVGIHEFRRGDAKRMIGVLISETVWNQLGDPLDRIGIGVVCLDGDGHLLAANALAANLCRLVDAPLEGEGPDRAAARLLALLQPGLARAATGLVSSQALRHPGATEPVIATLIPMAASGADPGKEGVFVLLRDPARALAADSDLMADLFGMTPAECRIAIRTTAGASAEAIAEELGLSPHTVRNHLKSVMKKTATSKQSETVALLWRLAAYTGAPPA